MDGSEAGILSLDLFSPRLTFIYACVSDRYFHPGLAPTHFLYLYFNNGIKQQPGDVVFGPFIVARRLRLHRSYSGKRCCGIFYLVLYTLPTIKSEAGIDGDSENFMNVSEPRKRIDAHF